ncbi:MAG: bifunctional proline dehydrogenase/L-glutamate gamma-semialdehyde dehydrogenase PutA [Alphaproteobacteria bacterium]|nr:bifunctional proline dehydrogenase/L-glutamate gamma-semialdehyde dehydrogenase PutA [Alphaproteobacteria bacterium]
MSGNAVHYRVKDIFNHLQSLYDADEEGVVHDLLEYTKTWQPISDQATTLAAKWVDFIRKHRIETKGYRAFLQEYRIADVDGVILLSLAEALLRIPDSSTANLLIYDKLQQGNWQSHIGKSRSALVNIASLGLAMASCLNYRPIHQKKFNLIPLGLVRLTVAQLIKPLIRFGLQQAMRVLGQQFIMGHHIHDALKRAVTYIRAGDRYSYDMLGEGAKTAADAERYKKAYQHAIDAIAKVSTGQGCQKAPGISIKLSALHPRYEISQIQRIQHELIPIVLNLCSSAKAAQIHVTFDAEEADRLELSLLIFQHLIHHPDLQGWEGLGLAVQAYQKRSLPTIEWLIENARMAGRKIMVRLVKGAYWDTEIKRAQEKGVSDYPVFTRKAATDLSYQVCAEKLLAAQDCIFPQFATHNAHTVAFIIHLAQLKRTESYEFQRLEGMGESLYHGVRQDYPKIPVRIYAPVGSHQDLLPYLVRRMLENGANSSFVNQIFDRDRKAMQLVSDPIQQIRAWDKKRSPKLPIPRLIYGSERLNAKGIDVTNTIVSQDLEKKIAHFANSFPLNAHFSSQSGASKVFSPADVQHLLGYAKQQQEHEIQQAFHIAHHAQISWSRQGAEARAVYLEKTAHLLEEQAPQLIGLLVYEAGKTMVDAIAEWREAIDFCRYYANQARRLFAKSQLMPGPTGERNELSLHGRGVFVAISPWNFPLAIFMGQVTAALAAGNAVLAKPAPQTPLIAYAAVNLLYQAGVPRSILHLIIGGADIGARLVADPLVNGVVFTGSTATAQAINRSLANRGGAIVPLVAETGGINAMIVDSSALLEQVVRDLLVSAFQSSGQRCSACRVVFVQEELKERLITMLTGAMKELRIGHPAYLTTDVGPVIDEIAINKLNQHFHYLEKSAHILYSCDIQKDLPKGHFFPPTLAELSKADILQSEVFGPILHLVSWNKSQLDHVIKDINATGYGLTLGIHSRIQSTIDYIQEHCRVGNIYVNRSMIGAVVGVHPFGGEGLSGTGPKAGGPNYLLRFATERLVSVDITAAGGNHGLLAQGSD